MASSDRPSPSLRRKILITGFILFHFGAVAVWVFPGTFPARTFLLTRSVPLPARRPDPETGSMRWRFEPQPVIHSYLVQTGQWQHWNLFAPNPMHFNRHLGGRVTYRSGRWREFTLPRVEQLGYFRAHLEARYREYQYGLTGPLAALEDLARFCAREHNDPADPPVRVTLHAFQLDVPRHDRPALRAPGAPPWVDYSRLLRDPALVGRYTLLDYAVKPEDLR